MVAAYSSDRAKTVTSEVIVLERRKAQLAENQVMKGKSMNNTRIAVETGGWLIAGFGLLLAVFNLPGLTPVMDGAFELVLWTGDDVLYSNLPEARLMVAVAGGIAFAWGFLQINLARFFGEKEGSALRKVVVRSYWAWFIVDGLGSLAAGAPLNLIGNALFLIALLVPFYLPIAKRRA